MARRRKQKKMRSVFASSILLGALILILLKVIIGSPSLPKVDPTRAPTETLTPKNESLITDAPKTVNESVYAAQGEEALASVPEGQDFESAKRSLRKLFSRGREFYCGCSYDFARRPQVDPTSCGMSSRYGSERATRIEWEHVVPASFYGRQFTAWKRGDPECQGSKSKKKGRECARKVSPEFRAIEGDMYNLVPAVGELNRARGDNVYGEIAGEPREFGACDFETLGDTTEPKEDVRGDIARIYFYMDARYPRFKIVSEKNLSLLERWSKADPLDAKESERLKKIEAVQGNSFFIGRLAMTKSRDLSPAGKKTSKTETEKDNDKGKAKATL